MRIILYPFSLLYGLIVSVRNFFYNHRILPSRSFPVPVIGVGNLSTGGTGKTPHVEYLISLLEGKYSIATLSRGYKRKSTGFVLAGEQTGVTDIGDEPYQFYSKFPKIQVAVDNSRTHGINTLLESDNPPEVIILDDSFQHRKVRPGLAVLLTDFYKLYTSDFVLPSGNLREFKCGARRADVIVVTKSPKVLSPITRRRVEEELKPRPNQKIFYSYIQHGNLIAIPGTAYIPEKFPDNTTAMLVAGIANTYPLEMYLKDKSFRVEAFLFPDHHYFTPKDVDAMIARFDNLLSKNKIIVTTEKDMMRLMQTELLKKIRHLPICYVPIKVKFHKQDEADFNRLILDYVKGYQGNSKLHSTES